MTIPLSILSAFLLLPFHGTWKAGETITQEEIEKIGIEECFKAEEIDSATLQRMKGKTYKADCKVPVGQLRYVKLLHYNFDGNPQMGELVCNKAITSDIIDIFKNLYDEHYQIGRMVLADEYDADDERSMADNNTSCFNYRHVSGTKVLSKHSLGMAIDINPLFNPCVRTKKGKTSVEPAAAQPYANRTKQFAHKITKNDLCYQLFIQHGFIWGGNWRSSKDYQHFEKN